MQPLAVYIHWPFCKSKCPYCDFNSHVREKISHKTWRGAYVRELNYFRDVLGNRQVTSIYFGGGTPSLMEAETVAELLQTVQKNWSVAEDAEITLEANPTSIEMATFKGFKEAGINRISMGIQALDDKSLKFLGREHSVEDALAALDIAKAIFDNVSFDLIYARPGQSIEEWGGELRQALSLAGDHISLYQLTIEKGTPFYSSHKAGEFVLPEEEIAAEMLLLTNAVTGGKGYEAYEVSNYARPGRESRHNLAYWNYQDYLGIGPGAHSRISYASGQGKNALTMIYHPERWMEEVGKHGCGIQQQQRLSEHEMMEESIMLGLRLHKGISHSAFRQNFGKSMESFFPSQMLVKLQDAGYIIWDEQGMRATGAGRLVLNSVIGELLSF